MASDAASTMTPVFRIVTEQREMYLISLQPIRKTQAITGGDYCRLFTDLGIMETTKNSVRRFGRYAGVNVHLRAG